MHERDLVLRFRLDGHWNHGTSIEASIIFWKVRNRDEVEGSLKPLVDAAAGRERLADVVNIVRDANGSYLVDTSQGSLIIQASGFSEI